MELDLELRANAIKMLLEFFLPLLKSFSLLVKIRDEKFIKEKVESNAIKCLLSTVYKHTKSKRKQRQLS